jgi:hypothetical protein
MVHERAPRRFDFVQNVKTLIVQLDNLLEVDRSTTPESRSSAALSAELGEGSGMRIDPEALAGNLPAHRGSKRMAPERRARIESTLAALHGWVEQATAEPRLVRRRRGEDDRGGARRAHRPAGDQGRL